MDKIIRLETILEIMARIMVIAKIIESRAPLERIMGLWSLQGIFGLIMVMNKIIDWGQSLRFWQESWVFGDGRKFV